MGSHVPFTAEDVYTYFTQNPVGIRPVSRDQAVCVASLVNHYRNFPVPAAADLSVMGKGKMS
eukprot:692589-Pelagomonas_calceolata.AAC.2